MPVIFWKLNLSGFLQQRIPLYPWSSPAQLVSTPAWPRHAWTTWECSLPDSEHLWCTSALKEFHKKKPVFPLKAEFTVAFQSNCPTMCKPDCPRQKRGMNAALAHPSLRSSWENTHKQISLISQEFRREIWHLQMGFFSVYFSVYCYQFIVILFSLLLSK